MNTMHENDGKLKHHQAEWKAPELTAQNVATAERFKSPFFVREATLEQTLNRVKEIDPSKRKILVYVGFHPNEGTDILTRKYADNWAEKFGATVVCHPTEETVKAIWEQRRPKNPDDTATQLPDDLIVNQDKYAKKFSLGNKDTVVIFLHGTPLGLYNEHKRKHGLPERTRGLEVSTPAAFNLEQASLATEETDDIKNELKREQPLKEKYAWPNGILVEYFYAGRPVQIDDPYIQRLLVMEREDYETAWAAQDRGESEWGRIEGMKLFSKTSHPYQLNIGPGYLAQDTPTEEDVKIFDEMLVKNFEKILARLAGFV